jgi:hypothetical protein
MFDELPAQFFHGVEEASAGLFDQYLAQQDSKRAYITAQRQFFARIGGARRQLDETLLLIRSRPQWFAIHLDIVVGSCRFVRARNFRNQWLAKLRALKLVI